MLVSTVKVSEFFPDEKPKHFKHKAMCMQADSHGILEHRREQPDLCKGQQPGSAPVWPWDGRSAKHELRWAEVRVTRPQSGT